MSHGIALVLRFSYFHLSLTFIRVLSLTTQWIYTVVIKRSDLFHHSRAVCSEPVTGLFLEQRALPWNRPYHQKLSISLPVRDGGAARARQVHHLSHKICFTKASTQRPTAPPPSLKQPNSVIERRATGTVTPRSFSLLRRSKKDDFKT